MERRGREPLARLVYAAWLALGGPATCTASDHTDARQFFTLLAELEEAGDLLHGAALEEALASLYAASDSGDEVRVQVLTIHKAKGLEFDHVYLPGLGRNVRGVDKPLLRWMEHPDHGLLLAPLPPVPSSGEDPTYAAIGTLHAARDAYETVRLLYVACTRARRSLTLAGHLNPAAQGCAPPANSLLQVIWEALEVAQEDLYAPSTEGAPDRMPEDVSSLMRLPASWSLPPFAPSPTQPAMPQRQASQAAELRGPSTPPRAHSRFRHVGTVTHAWLEQIGRSGVDAWSEQRLTAQLPRFRRRLGALGYPGAELDKGAQRVLELLVAAVTGEHGRWVLARHSESACELAVSGVSEGTRIEAVVDRTFVDVQGRRWVIDYKTSAPRSDEDPAIFLRNETELYRAQLEVYASLYALLEPNRPLNAALYFPAFDCLHVVVCREQAGAGG